MSYIGINFSSFLVRFYPMKTEKHGYTKSSDEYFNELREQVRQERERLNVGRVRCIGPLPSLELLPNQKPLNNHFTRCDYESFSKLHLNKISMIPYHAYKFSMNFELLEAMMMYLKQLSPIFMSLIICSHLTATLITLD